MQYKYMYIYIYINKSFKQIAKINQTRAQSWSNLPTSRPFYSRHAKAGGSWSLDFLDSNRQAKSSAVVRDLKITDKIQTYPECQGKIADVQNRKAVKGWLGQLLAQIMSWGRIIWQNATRSQFSTSAMSKQFWCTFGSLKEICWLHKKVCCAIHAHCEIHSIVYIYHYCTYCQTFYVCFLWS